MKLCADPLYFVSGCVVIDRIRADRGRNAPVTRSPRPKRRAATQGCENCGYISPGRAGLLLTPTATYVTFTSRVAVAGCSPFIHGHRGRHRASAASRRCLSGTGYAQRGYRGKSTSRHELARCQTCFGFCDYATPRSSLTVRWLRPRTAPTAAVHGMQGACAGQGPSVP